MPSKLLGGYDCAEQTLCSLEGVPQLRVIETQQHKVGLIRTREVRFAP